MNHLKSDCCSYQSQARSRIKKNDTTFFPKIIFFKEDIDVAEGSFDQRFCQLLEAFLSVVKSEK